MNGRILSSEQGSVKSNLAIGGAACAHVDFGLYAAVRWLSRRDIPRRIWKMGRVSWRFILQRPFGLTTGRLHHRLDCARIGMAGHSFGAYTTLAIAGQVLPGRMGQTITLGDRRIRAAMAMSPTVPKQQDKLDQAFGPIKIPGWHGSGQKDRLFQELIRTVTTAFWDAYLRDDAQAKGWLIGGGRETLLGDNAKFEKKVK